MDQLLIESVRKHSILYDTKSSNYSDQRLRQEAWEEVGWDLKISPESAKEKWNKLRRCFCNAINRRRSRATEGARKYVPWKFEQQMTFLLPSFETRLMYGDVDKSESQLSETNTVNKFEMEDEENDTTFNFDDINKSDTDYDEDNEIPGSLGESTENIRKRKHAKSKLNNNDIEIFKIKRENAVLRRAINSNSSMLETTSNPSSIPDLDETDMFFLSMARMTKKLPRHEQAKIKLTLSNDVLQAEVRAVTSDTQRIQNLVEAISGS